MPPGASTSTVVPLVLPINALAIGEATEILPSLGLASGSPTICQIRFSPVSSSISVTVAPNLVVSPPESFDTSTISARASLSSKSAIRVSFSSCSASAAWYSEFSTRLSLYEAALNISQLRRQELAISPHICLAGPSQMILCARGLHRPIPPCRGMPAGDALRLFESSAFKLAEMRKPHSHSAARRRIAVIVQLLERRQNVIQTEPVPDPRHFTQGRLGFIRGEKKAERSDESNALPRSRPRSKKPLSDCTESCGCRSYLGPDATSGEVSLFPGSGRHGVEY